MFIWTPDESAGGNTFGIIVQVADNANPPGTDTEAFQVTVNEVNQAPTLAAIADQTVNEGATLTLTAKGSDADEPTQTLTYSLAADAPAGATIHPASGVFTWTPAAGTAGDYAVTVEVSDDGRPVLEARATFTVTVKAGGTELVLEPPVLAPARRLELRWQAMPGVTYDVEAADRLPGPWEVLGEVTATDTMAEFTDPDGLAHGARFYRLRQKP